MKTLPLFLLASLALFVASCEDGGDTPYTAKFSGGGNATAATAADAAATPETQTPSGQSASSIVGTWTLSGEGTTWYATFSDSKSWIISDDKAGAKVRVYGTYTDNHGTFSGPMTNPGVGTGKIEGEYTANAMTLRFTEYWHDPAKTVVYKGSR